MGSVWAYGVQDYLSDISVAHLYNLHQNYLYRNLTRRYARTKPSGVNISERARSDTGGKPGYIRLDTVHQGNRDGEKGVYHINVVDEVTQ